MIASMRTCFSLLIAFVPSATGTTAHGQATFTPLGYRTVGSTASDVSADGSVVIGAEILGEYSEPFRWSAAEGKSPLPFSPEGLSSDGSVIVGVRTIPIPGGEIPQFEAVRWSVGGGLTRIWHSFSAAYGVSGDGSTVVGYAPLELEGGHEAFRWSAETGAVGLGYLPSGDYSAGKAVSADGSVVVGESFFNRGTAGGQELQAFRWTAGGGMIGLGDLDGGVFQSTARDLSADGTVVVGGSNSRNGNEAFRWTADGGMFGLGDLPGGEFGSDARDVSADGSLVVGLSNSGNGPTGIEAFLWTEGLGIVQLHDLLISAGVTNLTGWTLTEANAISADGSTIVGNGTNPSGKTEAWMATIPEPPTLVLASVTALMVFVFRSWVAGWTQAGAYFTLAFPARFGARGSPANG